MSAFFESPPGSGLYVFSPTGTPPEGSPGTQPPVSYGWHTLESARARWTDALNLDDEILGELLEVGRIQCVAYAPSLPANTAVPVNYRMAQLAQARAIFNNSISDADGAIGPDGFTLNPPALDKYVKAMLRPTSGVSYVG